MIRYQNDGESFRELLHYVRRELNCNAIINRSDVEKAIQEAVNAVFPGSTHFYCTIHVRSNIEQQFVKCCAIQDKLRILLDLMSDSSESLTQSETRRISKLSELNNRWRTMHDRDIPMQQMFFSDSVNIK